LGKKSDVVWLVQPGMREIPRKAIEEAKELLGQGKDYARHVVRAWLEGKRVRWHGYTFHPKRLGVEVYLDGERERIWSNKAVEIAFYNLALDEQALAEAKLKAGAVASKTERKTSDEDQVDVDVVVNVEAPKQAKDVEGEAEVGEIEEDVEEDIVEAEDIDLEAEDLDEDLEE
jgi:hypothetical protein